MDRIGHSLSEAAAFQREGKPACAYYKYIRAFQLIIDLLAQTSLFSPQSLLPRATVEGLFVLGEQCLTRAEQYLESVLDLEEFDARQAKESGILGLNPYSRIGRVQTEVVRPNTPDFARPEPYQTIVSASGSGPESELNHQVHPNHPNNQNQLNYGPEPELGVRDDAELPLIPNSYLAVIHCQLVLQLQLLVQKLEVYLEADAKQQANALYLNSLKTFIGRLKQLTLKKLDQEDGIKLSQQHSLRDHSPADLARQITLLQHALLRRITGEELKLGSGVRDQAFLIPNLTAFLALSQYLCHWCQYEVLRWRKDQDRAAALTLLVRTANYLLDIGNFDGLFALIRGLTARPIYRLSSTLALLPKKTRLDLNNLEVLISDRRDYAQLKDALERRNPPLIPPLAIMLVDRERKRQISNQWDRIRGSAYDELFVIQPVTQHYLLTQPFRWEEELMALSTLREPPSKGRNETDPGATDLSTADMERWCYGEGDFYKSLGKGMVTDYEKGVQPSFKMSPPPPPPPPKIDSLSLR